MNVHQKIYDTRNLPEEEALAIVGGGEIQSRRERLSSFLKDHEWDPDEFVAWLPSYNMSRPVPPQLVQRSKPLTEADIPKMPSAFQKLSNLAQALRQWKKAGYKLVKKKESSRRLQICESCQYLTEDTACLLCGCNMKLKCWLDGMVCKANKW